MSNLDRLVTERYATPLISKMIKARERGEGVGSVSANQDVTGINQPSKVAGSSETAENALEEYQAIFGGVELPFMSDEQFQKDHQGFQSNGQETHTEEGESAQKAKDSFAAQSPNGEALSQEDQQELDKLKSRDREVRAHEQAHLSAAGQYARGGIHYEYQQGPDGRKYAVGGHVNIDVSEEESPEQTISKMRQVRRAALAPAEPSGADRSVAAEASRKEQAAQKELMQSNADQRQEGPFKRARIKGRPAPQKGADVNGGTEINTSEQEKAEQVGLRRRRRRPAPRG